MLKKDFDYLYSTYYIKMVRFAKGYVKDCAIAEDFVSEAFSKYWENRKSLDKDTIPQNYILTIVKNKCLNYLQHLKVRKNAEEFITQQSLWQIDISIQTLSSCDPNVLFSKEIGLIVKSTLQSLPDKTKKIYILSREKGLTYKEIADNCGLSVKSIEFHISKALSVLRIALKDYIAFLPFSLYIY